MCHVIKSFPDSFWTTWVLSLSTVTQLSSSSVSELQLLTAAPEQSKFDQRKKKMEEKRKIQQSSNDFEMSSLFVPLSRMNNFQLGGYGPPEKKSGKKSTIQNWNLSQLQRSVNFRMSFWYLKFSKKPTKSLTKFCPEFKMSSNQ